MRTVSRALLALSLPVMAIPAAVPAGAAADLSGCAFASEIPLGTELDDTWGAVLTPDGSRVVFSAPAVAGGANDVWVVPVTGGTPTRLTTAPSGGSGASYIEVIDNGRVLVIGALTSPTRSDLYTLSLDGAPPIRLNPDTLATGYIYGWELSPDKTRVAFWGWIETTDHFDIYVASVNGPIGTKVTITPTAPGSFVGTVVWSPDSSHVAYVADHVTLDQYLAFSSNGTEQGEVVSWYQTAANEVDYSPQFTPDSQTVFYIGDLEVDGRRELFRNDVSDPSLAGQMRINDPAVPGGATGVDWFGITPDGTRVAWIADFEANAGQDLLYSRDVAAAGPEQLISVGPNVLGNGAVQAAAGPQFTPDSSRIVYVGDLVEDDDNDVFSSPVAGGINVQTTLTVSTNPDRDAATYFDVTPDSSRVVFRGDFTTDGHQDLYSVPVAGGVAPTQLTAFSNPTSNVGIVQLTADGTRAVFTADGNTEGAFDLYAVPTSGGTAFMVNTPAPSPNLDVNYFDVRETVVAYEADFTAFNVSRAYVSSILAPGHEAPLLTPVADTTRESWLWGEYVGPVALGASDRITDEVDRLSTVWIGDLDGDGIVDTCDPDAVPGVSISTTTTAVSLTFSVPTNQPAAAALDTILAPPAGHTWGGATAAWTSPTALTITRAADTTVAVGDVLTVASSWGLRRQWNRSPIFTGALAAVTGTAPGGGTTTLHPFGCPSPASATPFTDIAGSFAAADIACLYGAGLVSGTSATTYSPANPVTREQMAIFLVNAYRTATGLDPAPAANPFSDIGGSFAHNQILQLVNLGITAGTSATTYSPQNTVTRDQMAVFLVRLYEAILLAPAPTGPTPFTDIAGNFAETRIAQLVTLGITAGTSATTYSPTQAVTREQMAVFVVRLLTTATN